MEQIMLDSVEDINKAVDMFYTLPVQMRPIIAKRMHARLKELGGFVRVFSDNPLLRYPSECFIIQPKGDVLYDRNPYRKYRSMVRTDEVNFNEIVYNDIVDQLEKNNPKSQEKISCVTNERNNFADEMYTLEYPDSSTIIDLIKVVAHKMENYFRFGGSQDIFKSSMDDLEFIIATNKLSDSHIKRYLLATMYLKDVSVFTNKLDSELLKRLIAIFNTQISIVKHRKDNFMLTKDFNNDALQNYFKIQKRTHEVSLVESAIPSDYIRKPFIGEINDNKVDRVYDKFKDNNNLSDLDLTDLFKLKHNGFDNIKGRYMGDSIVGVYVNEGSQFLVMRNKKDSNTYHFIGESSNKDSKKYKVKLKAKNVDRNEIETIIESTLIINERVNRI